MSNGDDPPDQNQSSPEQNASSSDQNMSSAPADSSSAPPNSTPGDGGQSSSQSDAPIGPPPPPPASPTDSSPNQSTSAGDSSSGGGTPLAAGGVAMAGAAPLMSQPQAPPDFSPLSSDPANENLLSGDAANDSTLSSEAGNDNAIPEEGGEGLEGGEVAEGGEVVEGGEVATGVIEGGEVATGAVEGVVVATEAAEGAVVVTGAVEGAGIVATLLAPEVVIPLLLIALIVAESDAPVAANNASEQQPNQSVDNTVSTCTDQQEKKDKTCATEYPDLNLCYELPPKYMYDSESDAFNAIKRASGRSNLKKVSFNESDSGPCEGQGQHIGVKDGKTYIASIVSCPCCIDTPVGPALSEKFAVI